MTRHLVHVLGAVLTLSIATASPVSAQQRIEASVFGGYTFSEGIEASQSRVILGQVYDQLDVTSGGSWGFTFGVFVTDNMELEFLYSRQWSSLEASGPVAAAVKFGDMSVDNWMGNFVYNYGEQGNPLRPFVFGGLGATRYIPGEISAQFPILVANQDSINSESRFSTTWGGGVKFYAKGVGVKVMGRWTPTYIKSDAGGLWCDPFYPTCWVVADADYSNQFELSGGVTFRF